MKRKRKKKFPSLPPPAPGLCEEYASSGFFWETTLLGSTAPRVVQTPGWCVGLCKTGVSTASCGAKLHRASAVGCDTESGTNCWTVEKIVGLLHLVAALQSCADR